MLGSAHMGEGDWSCSHTATSSCCQIEFVARQGPPLLMHCGTRHNTRTHTHRHTHIFLIRVRAGSTDSWASPGLPQSLQHILFCEGIPSQAEPTDDKKLPAFEWESWDWQAEQGKCSGAADRRLDAENPCCLEGSVCCSSNTLTSTQSPHCLGKPPFCALN